MQETWLLSETVPPVLQLASYASIVWILIFSFQWLTANRPYKNFPLATLPGLNAKESFQQNAQGTVAQNLADRSGPFLVVTHTGPKIVLPNRYADELRVRPELDFNEAFRKDFFAHYPGFEAFRASMDHPDLIPTTLKTKVSNSLGLVTGQLVQETTNAIPVLYGDSSTWQSIMIKQQNLELIARLSSRIFLGVALCRNREWLEIAKNHTANCFLAAGALRKQPAFLRRMMHKFMPHNKAIQKHYQDAKRIITPEVELRKKRAEEALANGGKPPKVSDTIGWMVEVARGRKIDYVAAQLSLTVAAIHATTEALTFALADLALHSDIIPELRNEVIAVVGVEGWTKQTLYKLQLMDSFLKESQRMHPPSPVSMNRKVLKSFTLSDGIVLPQNAIIMVAGTFMDPSVYKDPKEFDAARFLKLRHSSRAGNNAYQYVTTSSSHLGFGHGTNACPGRFMAANELKIALAHLIMKYDWKIDDDDGSPPFLPFELANMTNPSLRLMLKRRREEIAVDLDLVADMIDE